MRKVGAWLAVNGEAIYGTRPWTRCIDGIWHFTTKGDALYAISRDWPQGEAAIAVPGKVAGVELLGGGKIDFEQNVHGIRLRLPEQHQHTTAAAYVFKIRRTM
jgi:alpha-L-fucosidase